MVKLVDSTTPELFHMYFNRMVGRKKAKFEHVSYETGIFLTIPSWFPMPSIIIGSFNDVTNTVSIQSEYYDEFGPIVANIADRYEEQAHSEITIKRTGQYKLAPQ